MMLVCDVIFIFVIIMTACRGNPSASSSSKLYDDLLKGYQKFVRPGEDHRDPTNIAVEFNLAAIKTFKEINSQFSVTGFFILTWNDERLIWNPAMYNGTTSIMLPQKVIWIPQLMMVNPFMNLKMLGFADAVIRVLPSGDVFWNVGDVFEAVCDPDVTYFPFDTHTCILLFVSWGYSPKEIGIETPKTQFYLSYFTPNPIWDLKSTNISTDENEFLTSISLAVEFTRRPAYFIVNIILPLTFICFINQFVFLLPADSGERIGFSITVLLAIAVFMTILSDTLPKNSQPHIPILCYLLLLQMISSVLIMACTIFSLRFYMRDDTRKPVPRWLVSMVKCCKCTRRKQKVGNSTLIVSMDHYSYPQEIEKGANRKKTEDLKLEDAAKMNNADLPSRELFYDRVTWRDVSHVFDGICLVVFSVLIVTVTVPFLIYLATAGTITRE